MGVEKGGNSPDWTPRSKRRGQEVGVPIGADEEEEGELGGDGEEDAAEVEGEAAAVHSTRWPLSPLNEGWQL